MEAGESRARQSGLISASNLRPDPYLDHYNHRPRELLERQYHYGEQQRESEREREREREREIQRERAREHHSANPAMATAALISPSTPYHPHPHQSPFSGSYLPHPGHPGHHSQNANVNAMISPVESTRRTSDDGDANHRQSLPSIQEVIGAKPNHAYAVPGPGLTPNLPSPFTPSGPSRSYADAPPPPPPPAPSHERERHPSPRPFHPSTYSRAEPLAAFSDPSRSAAPRPGPPPLSIYPGGNHHHHPSPTSMRPEAHEVEQRHPYPESAHVNGHYGPGHSPHSQPHSGAQPVAHSPYSHQPVPLPPGQLPLTTYPISPRHSVGPPLHSPYDQHRPLGPEEDYTRSRKQYESSMSRPYETWTYQEQLARMGTSARTLLNFAETYGRLAAEEHGQGPPLPGRLPTEVELADMMSNCEWLRGMLEHLRGVVKQSIMNERVREGSRPKQAYMEDEEMHLFAEGMKPNFAVGEVKKRRGRAAPPGRCHSCNRVDTPEWRRGPDGARTLCNACGLHYAKLERRRQNESKGSRSKGSEERIP